MTQPTTTVRLRRVALIVAVVLLGPIGVLAQSSTGSATATHWVGTWMTAQVALLPPDPSQPSAQGSVYAPVLRVNDQTIRQTVHVSIGGSTIRVAFTNPFGTVPVAVGAAYVSLRRGGGDDIRIVAPGVPLTFDGTHSATLEVGSVLVSDPVDLDVPPLADLVVDLYLPGDPWAPGVIASGHSRAWTTNQVSRQGNHTGLTDLPVDSTTQSWLYLSRVDVLAPAHTGAIVTLGDSITEGHSSTPDANARWPDVLAQRLVGAKGERALAVLNAGISGNRVLSHSGLSLPGRAELTGDEANAGFGPSAMSRFDRDVLLQPGVTHVIILESINDIGMAGGAAEPTAERIIAGHRALIQRARARGLIVYGGTLTPFEGAAYWTETGEAKRVAVNDWIRNSGAYDAVIDFDAAMRDPDNPNRFVSTYHPGDWLHPNDEGYRRMGEAVELDLFWSTAGRGVGVRTGFPRSKYVMGCTRL